MEIQPKELLSPRSQLELFSTEHAAAYIGVTPRTLEVWRCTRRYAIPYVKVGRLVRYRRNDLDQWLSSRTVAA
jgi:excisionase family DNA binding protein